VTVLAEPADANIQGHRHHPADPGLIPSPARQIPRIIHRRPAPADNCCLSTSQEVVMNPIHRTHRLSITLAGLAAAVLALPACQGTATAASPTPPPTPAQAMVQQTQNGLTFTDLKDLAKVKRDLFQRLAQQTQTGLPFTDLKDLAKVKRGLFRR
jgi:hypothetical protein